MLKSSSQVNPLIDMEQASSHNEDSARGGVIDDLQEVEINRMSSKIIQNLQHMRFSRSSASRGAFRTSSKVLPEPLRPDTSTEVQIAQTNLANLMKRSAESIVSGSGEPFVNHLESANTFKTYERN